MTTESYSPIETLMKYYGNSTKHGAHVPFNFGLVIYRENNIIEFIDRNIKEWLDNMPKNMVANWVVSDINTDITIYIECNTENTAFVLSNVSV